MNQSWLVYTIASIWAVTLIATSIVLRGTPQSNLVIEILSASTLFSSLLLIFACKKNRTVNTKS